MGCAESMSLWKRGISRFVGSPRIAITIAAIVALTKLYSSLFLLRVRPRDQEDAT
jgi:hypothetical protein